MIVQSERPLGQYRICDLSGQIAGAAATKLLAAFGAEVIRVEDPVRQGRWDILRTSGPYVDERRGVDLGGAFNNHNVEKLGVTINLRDPRGRELLAKLIACSDVVTENFSAGVLAGLGFPYDELCRIRPDIVYVANSGFGHTGPYRRYKSWGPIIQAVSGLTFESGLPDHEPAGWGYSLMDHLGGAAMAIAVLAALHHRERTGQGQAIDIAMTDVAVGLLGPALLDVAVNGRPRRRNGAPNSNGSEFAGMVPHGVFPVAGADNWIAIACRDDDDWCALRTVVDEPWSQREALGTVAGRRAEQDDLHALLATWTSSHDGRLLSVRLREAGVPASVVARPEDRIEHDPATREAGLWPAVTHPQIGEVRVEGIPFHLSEDDWEIRRPAPCLGADNDHVFGELLGLSDGLRRELQAEGVI
jgi:crotonobetainyl-CoA:carnitine CoA-transferase CaiB-like acyl-CoA transferase